MSALCHTAYCIRLLFLGCPHCSGVTVFPGFIVFMLPPLRRKVDRIRAVRDGFPGCNRAAACNVTLAEVLIVVVGGLGVRDWSASQVPPFLPH